MAEEHDKTHRLLFNFASMVEDLIRVCLPGDWVEHLDFSTLEQVSERFIDADGDMKRREADLIWRLRYHVEQGPEISEDWFYIYLNLEHMSQIRKFMAVDTEGYRVGAWKQILLNDRDQMPDGLLPPILSVVFYNGDQEWRPKMLSELVRKIPGAPQGFELGTFALVDAQRWNVTRVDTPLEALFKLEQVDSIEDVEQATRSAQTVIDPNSELSKAFVALLNNVIFPSLAPQDAKPLRIETLEETSMLEQRIKRIAQGLILQGKTEGMLQGKTEGILQGKAEGILQGKAEGILQGKADGRREGQKSLFLKLFATKFEDVPASIHRRAATASLEDLETWAERLLTAESAEDVFLD